MIAAKLKPRGVDDWGDGAFDSPRGDKKHKGIDYCCDVGAEILSPCIGQVTKLGYPYSYKKGFNFRYVEVTDLTGLKHRVFYIKPAVNLGQQVTILAVIGHGQDISGKFSSPRRKPMKNHVHYEILDKGQPINPEGFHNVDS